MRKRHEQKPGVAEKREQRAGGEGEQQAFAPADQGQDIARKERQEKETGPDEAVNTISAGANPIRMPCRPAASPSAQNSAAAVPQATPRRVPQSSRSCTVLHNRISDLVT
jgi:hypothetical protein